MYDAECMHPVQQSGVEAKKQEHITQTSRTGLGSTWRGGTYCLSTSQASFSLTTLLRATIWHFMPDFFTTSWSTFMSSNTEMGTVAKNTQKLEWISHLSLSLSLFLSHTHILSLSLSLSHTSSLSLSLSLTLSLTLSLSHMKGKAWV